MLELVVIGLVASFVLAFCWITRKDALAQVREANLVAQHTRDDANSTVKALKEMLDEDRKAFVDRLKVESSIYESRLKILNDRLDVTFGQAMHAMSALTTVKIAGKRPQAPQVVPPPRSPVTNGSHPRSSFPEDVD